MTTLVNEDLSHIPRTKKWDTQAELRMLYNAVRRHDLTLGKPKKETLARCIEFLKTNHPNASPAYDSDYFQAP